MSKSPLLLPLSLSQMQNFLERRFTFLLFVVLIMCTFISGWRYRQELFQVTDRAKVSQAYSQSQYILGDQAPQKIDDATLYTYAADAYFKGEDPTTINFEHPPLGKYMFGVSLWLFNRVLALNLLWYVLALSLFAALLRRLQFSSSFTLGAVLYLGLGSSLDKHLKTALLDTQTLVWSLGFFLVLFQKKETWRKYIGLGLVLGCFIATKYFFPILFLYVGLLGIWTIVQKTYFKAVATLLVTGLVYLASYGAYFVRHSSVVEFLQFEWYRFKWWTGNRTIPKFIILQTIVMGKFPMWWETSKKYQIDSDWNISWPILFFGHLVALIQRKFSLEKVIVLAFSLGLLVIYLFGSAVYGRYLLQLLPFWIILIGWALQQLFQKLKNT